jgi:hypothetical protein
MNTAFGAWALPLLTILQNPYFIARTTTFWTGGIWPIDI